MSPRCRTIFRRAEEERERVHVPVVCFFEIALLLERGRLRSRIDFDAWHDLVVAQPVLPVEQLGWKDVREARGLTGRVDLFDRLLEPTWFGFFFMLARTGIRLGEGLGLKVGDIDLAGSFFTVRRTYTHGRVGTPKNGKTRRVDVSNQLAGVLRDRIRRIEAMALAAGIPADLVADSWLFTNSAGQPLDESRAHR